jgi:hypothetical protein
MSQKNYMRTRSLELDDDISRKKLERKKIWDASKVSNVNNFAVTPLSDSFRKIKTQKGHDRKGYLMRKCHPNTPFALDPDNFDGDDISRLEFIIKLINVNANDAVILFVIQVRKIVLKLIVIIMI